MLVPLAEATADTCGGKAGALGALIRAQLPVPDGVVLPFVTCDALGGVLDPRTSAVYDGVVRGLGRWLDTVGDPPVAVRSSAANEDTAAASAAGQHDSFLGVQGVDAVADAVRACRSSLWSPRAVAYRDTSVGTANRGSAYRDGFGGEPLMAVIVQRHVDAEVSGVMFTPAKPTGATVIEASWGLGPSVVEGRVTPDTYRVSVDGSVTSTIADKPTALDRRGGRIVVRDVATSDRTRAAMATETAVRLAQLGREVTAVLGGPQDIEWAIEAESLWLLQARPVTADLPPSASVGRPGVLNGAPGSRGTATGPARIVHGPDDFPRVQPGDILVCQFTDPAWTPLLRIVAGVVTETGGVLSHAAIVAREQRIPAVLGVPNATTHLHDGADVTIDGATGVVRWLARAERRGARGGI